jgi:mono/diheme cytochrome c family protein
MRFARAAGVLASAPTPLSFPVHAAVLLACGFLPLVSGCRDDAEAPAVTRETAAPARIDPAIAARLPPGVTLDMVEEGREHFNRTCIACHGPGGEGTQLGPPLRDERWLHVDGSFSSIVEVVRQGVENPREYAIPMPVLGGGGFSEEELRAVASYTYALRFGAR